MTAQQVFSMAMDLINKRLANGTINPTTTAVYAARALGMLTAWQNEMAILLDVDTPAPITALTDNITIEDYASGCYFLAAHLILVEDPASSSFFNQKYEENRNALVRRQKATETAITDSYPTPLN